VALASSVNTPGDDNDLAWNDRHLQYVWLWLLRNERSPYYGCPSMLLTAMDVDRPHWPSLRKAGRSGKYYIRFSVRVRLTARFKVVLSGEFLPRIDKRTRNGIVRAFTLLPQETPIPLPMPPWIRGSIKITSKGIQLMVSSASKPRVFGEKSRLFNPFGVK